MYPPGSKVPALTILFHPEIDRVGERALLWDAGTQNGEAFLARRHMTFRPPRGGGPARPLEDPYVSRRPIRFTAARFGGIRIDCTMTGTRVVANDDWISENRVFLGVEVDRGVVLVLSERISVLLHHVTEGHDESVPAFGLVGENPSMLRLRHEIRSCAAEPSPILLYGEAGSGKKTVARAIHDAGGKDRPWVTLSCVNDTPFTDDRGDDPGPRCTSVPDLMARASGGTLLLDAVDRMRLGLQAELLRALDDERCGVRILATCSCPRSRGSAGPLIEKPDWRRIEVPPLHRRRDDVARLIFHFLREDLEEHEAAEHLAPPGPFAPPWFPVRLVAALTSYDWPDNVRQLRRVARRLARENHTRKQIDTRIDLEELLEGGSENSSTGWGGWSIEDSRAGQTPAGRRKKFSETEILSALRAHRWQAEPAAAHLGITPEALFAMMEKFFEKGERRRGPRRSSNPF